MKRLLVLNCLLFVAVPVAGRDVVPDCVEEALLVGVVVVGRDGREARSAHEVVRPPVRVLPRGHDAPQRKPHRSDPASQVALMLILYRPLLVLESCMQDS